MTLPLIMTAASDHQFCPVTTTHSSGFCTRCQTVHRLGPGNSQHAALDLMERIELHSNIDIISNTAPPDPRFSTQPLFGEERGKMFGVLECSDQAGQIHRLYAFSGQFNGQYLVDGWVPPLFDVAQFTTLTESTEKKIKTIGYNLEELPRHSPEWLALRKLRKELSRSLMQEIFQLYRLTNFRGETKPLDQIFFGMTGIPTGTGDCCSPKLLHYAATHELRPLGICEFFWGRENKSRTAFHRNFYNSCEEKCAPILGFLLCGR